MHRHPFFALLVALAAACVTPGEPPPTRWFEPEFPSSAPPRAEPAGTLELGRIGAAPALGTAIAWRLSPVELTFSSTDRWTAEPAALVADALRAALFESGRLREARGGGAARLDVHVRRFEGNVTDPPSAEVELVAVLTSRDDLPAETRVFRAGVPLEEGGHEGLARAMGLALERVLSELATWLETRLRSGA